MNREPNMNGKQMPPPPNGKAPGGMPPPPGMMPGGPGGKPGQKKEMTADELREVMKKNGTPQHGRGPMGGPMIREKPKDAKKTLLKLIQEKGLKNSAVYKKANVSKQHFSKIINDPNAKPSKPTAIALALALELDLEDTRDLIGRAGYALTNSSTFDLIIRYFIEHKQYNVVEINIALYEFDQSLLGN